MKQIKITDKGKVEKADCSTLRLPTGARNNLLMDDYVLSYPTVIVCNGEKYTLFEHKLESRILIYATGETYCMEDVLTMRIYY